MVNEVELIMICSECGGRIQVLDGVCSCESCGRQIDLKLPYEQIDVFVCDSASDEELTVEKESQMVQLVNVSLQETGAKAYTRKKVEGDDSVDDVINYMSAYRAKIIILVSSSKESLEKLYDEYSAFLNDKTIITLYSGILPKDFPDGLKKYQALNYDSIGAMKDLQKGISDTLGIKENDVDITKLYKKDYKLTIVFSVALVLSILVLIVYVMIRIAKSSIDNVVPLIPTESSNDTEPSASTEPSELSDEEIFAEAKQLSDDGKYAEAIDMFESIHDYDHSVDELSILFSKYAGYYYDETDGVSFHFNKTGSESATVTIQKTIDDSKLIISEDFILTGIMNTIQFTDSLGNSGTLSIELENDGIVFTIDTTNEVNEKSFGNSTYSFNLTERSDAPLKEAITLDTIKYWLDNDYYYSDFIDDGYSLVFSYYYDEYEYNHSALGMGKYFTVDNSEIYLVFFDVDFSIGNYYADESSLSELTDPKLYAVAVDSAFLSGYDVDSSVPTSLDGLYIMPNMHPCVVIDGWGYTVNDGKFLIIDESSINEEYKELVLYSAYGADGPDPYAKQCRNTKRSIR